LNATFVDSQLKWANGIAGKIDRLLLNLTEGEKHHKIVTKLKKLSDSVNKIRNAVAHQGEFCNETEAKEAIRQSKEFIEGLVQIYEPGFSLKESHANKSPKLKGHQASQRRS
jgi:hypothetical protein